MILKDYLKINNFTQQGFSDEVEKVFGKKIPQGTLAKYVNGQRIPRKPEMKLIYDFTNGKVSPNDFYLT
tara:strand:- start:300 stop:506 length:207 start_codon:yes stop_codon:yes gene_type:complete